MQWVSSIMQSNGVPQKIPEPTYKGLHRAGLRYRGCASILRRTFLQKACEKEVSVRGRRCSRNLTSSNAEEHRRQGVQLKRTESGFSRAMQEAGMTA